MWASLRTTSEAAWTEIKRKRPFVEGASLALTIGLLVVTTWVNYDQSQALEKQIELARADSKASQLAELGRSLGSANPGARAAALYGLLEYTKAFPESRTQTVQIYAVHLRTAEGFEKAVTAGLLRRATQLRGIPEDKQLGYDLANVDLSSLFLEGLVSRSGYFVGTIFWGAQLGGSRWNCVDATQADFRRAGLAGARLERINLSGARMSSAIIDAETTISDAYWDLGNPPHWPKDSDFHVPERVGGSQDFTARC